MRVIVDYRPALRARTGVGEYVHELVRALAAPGGPAPRGALTLFTASWKDRPPPSLGQQLGVTVVDRRAPGRALTWAWNRAGVPPIEWLAGSADVVHAATPVEIPSRRARSVLTIHDLHFLRHPDRMAAEMRRDFPRLVHAHARRAAAIVASSSYTAIDVVRSLEVAAERVHLCPPGPPGWAEAVRAARRDHPPEHILFMGTLEPRKNVGVLIEAYARLRDRRPGAPPLVVAGGHGSGAEAWQARAGALGLDSSLQWPGYVDEQTRLRLFTGAYMLVLPSFDEGFGLPVLEAMACGVPVVISTGGSLPEVAADAASPVEPGDVDGFCAAMEALLDPEAAEAATRRGLARANTFSWSACANRVWQAYCRAAEATS